MSSAQEHKLELNTKPPILPLPSPFSSHRTFIARNISDFCGNLFISCRHQNTFKVRSTCSSCFASGSLTTRAGHDLDAHPPALSGLHVILGHTSGSRQTCGSSNFLQQKLVQGLLVDVRKQSSSPSGAVYKSASALIRLRVCLLRFLSSFMCFLLTRVRNRRVPLVHPLWLPDPQTLPRLAQPDRSQTTTTTSSARTATGA